VFGTLDDYPPGHTKFFLRKTLGSPGGPHRAAGQRSGGDR
jgi:hypothetical protein